jgi:Flp pilus assembly protein TadD
LPGSAISYKVVRMYAIERLLSSMRRLFGLVSLFLLVSCVPPPPPGAGAASSSAAPASKTAPDAQDVQSALREAEEKAAAKETTAEGVNAIYAPVYERFWPTEEIVSSHANALFGKQFYAEAVSVVSAALERGMEPGADLLNVAGMAAFAADNPLQAVFYFNRALAASPGDPRTVNNVAIVYLAERRYPDALQILDSISPEAASSDPDLGKRIALNKAMALALTGDADAAEAMLSHYMEPLHVYRNIAYFAMAGGRKDIARHYLNRILAESPRFDKEADDALRTLDGGEGEGYSR